MERDFLGLNSMDSSVKQEISDEDTNWIFTKTASSFPQFATIRAGLGQDKIVTEPRLTADAFDIQNISLSLSNPVIKPGFLGFHQNVAGQVVGFTEPWNKSKSSTVIAPQMTIFYGGTVSVYEGISPEKAQAIMLLAGNDSFLRSNKNPPSSVLVNGGVPAGKDQQVVAKTAEVSCAHVSKPQNQRSVPSRGLVSMPALTPSVVPQFRKASLARFLEKRKERVMSSGPYNTCEKKQPEGGIAENDNTARRS